MTDASKLINVRNCDLQSSKTIQFLDDFTKRKKKNILRQLMLRTACTNVNINDLVIWYGSLS